MNDQNEDKQVNECINDKGCLWYECKYDKWCMSIYIHPMVMNDIKNSIGR